MLTVFKYRVTIGDYFELNMPDGAKILTVQLQNGAPYLWVLVDPKAPYKLRRFRFAGTGHPITELPASLAYVGTFQLNDGALVFHIFEALW